MKTLPLIALLMLTGCGCQSNRGFPESHQIRNFDRVTDQVWRGAQPDRDGFKWLIGQGCRTVINLSERGEGLPNERDIVHSFGASMTYWNPSLSGTAAPDKRVVDEILRGIDGLPQPVFVHCQHGCDRTGTIIACWRIRHGWTPQQAQQEADCYGMSKWELGMRNFIKHYTK